jgi:molybdenum cofactor guanylyltransferase
LRTAIILAGGRSSRMGGEKGLTIFNGKPLIAHAIERLRPVVDEIIIVVGSECQKEKYLTFEASVIIDKIKGETPLVGAYSGFLEAQGDYTFMTGGDQPLINTSTVELLFREAKNHDAATPTWPNGWIEPLHTVYRTTPTAKCAHSLIITGEKRLRILLRCLKDVKFIPMDTLKQLDPNLLTLIDVDTEEDLQHLKPYLSDEF